MVQTRLGDHLDKVSSLGLYAGKSCFAFSSQSIILIQVIFVKIEFGAVFFLVSCTLLMTSNLGKRKAGEASAYSVFNENCEAIDGTLTAQQFEREIRHGPVAN